MKSSKTKPTKLKELQVNPSKTFHHQNMKSKSTVVDADYSNSHRNINNKNNNNNSGLTSNSNNNISASNLVNNMNSNNNNNSNSNKNKNKNYKLSPIKATTNKGMPNTGNSNNSNNLNHGNNNSNSTTHSNNTSSNLNINTNNYSSSSTSNNNSTYSGKFYSSQPHTTKNQPVSIMSLFLSTLPLDIKYLHMNFPYYDNSKHSAKSLGVVKAYSANTHQGTVRDYNEDRVSIILNIVRPNLYNGSFWPKCSFFGVYDGHGGSGCAEFLRDHLHHFVVKDEHFPVNPREALMRGFEAAEKEFMTKHAFNRSGTEIIDRSGSCAIVSLVVDDAVYVANVGDSRAVLSKNSGREIVALSRDHKPDDEFETKRVTDAGGRVYQTQTNTKNMSPCSLNLFNVKVHPNQILTGPSRVFPGRLSVSRSFGDSEAKTVKFGGNPNVITADPEVQVIKLTEEHDFIVLGCKWHISYI